MQIVKTFKYYIIITLNQVSRVTEMYINQNSKEKSNCMNLSATIYNKTLYDNFVNCIFNRERSSLTGCRIEDEKHATRGKIRFKISLQTCSLAVVTLFHSMWTLNNVKMECARVRKRGKNREAYNTAGN